MRLSRTLVRLLCKVPCVFGRHRWKLIDATRGDHLAWVMAGGGTLEDELSVEIRCMYCGKKP